MKLLCEITPLITEICTEHIIFRHVLHVNYVDFVWNLYFLVSFLLFYFFLLSLQF